MWIWKYYNLSFLDKKDNKNEINIIDKIIAIIREPRKKATININGKNNAKRILYFRLINGLLKILI